MATATVARPRRRRGGEVTENEVGEEENQYF